MGTNEWMISDKGTDRNVYVRQWQHIQTYDLSATKDIRTFRLQSIQVGGQNAKERSLWDFSILPVLYEMKDEE